MKKILIGVVVLVVLLVAGIAIVPQLVPLETYKGEITNQVRAATGRDMTIGGDIRLSLLPSIELEVEDVSFSNAPGGKADAMATLSLLRLKLELGPLLGGSVEVASFVLVDPVVHLEIDADGNPNWTFAAAESGAQPAEAAQSSDQAPQPAGAGGGAGLADLKLGDVRIENGTVTYADAGGAEYRVSEIDMKVNLPALDQPLRAEGSLVYNNEKLSLSLGATTPARLMAGERADIEAKLKSAALALDYAGGVVATPLAADGKVELSVPSIRKLAAWAGTPIEFEGSGLGPFRVKGTVAVDGQKYSFSDAEIALDDLAATGALAVDLGRKRPFVKGRLDVANLDLNPYLPPEEAGGGGTASPDTASSGTASSGAAPAADWSDDPIDLTALRLVDADLAFSAGSLAIQNMKIGRSALTVLLKAGDLVVDLSELQLYDGSGAARIRVDARGEVPAVEKSIRISGVQAEPLLRDAAGFERLGGTADAEISFTAKGRSEREMVANLNGSGAVTFLNGAIKGINLGAMVRNVQGAFLGAKSSAPQKTDFAELSGTFRIDNGFLRNTDLALKAPLLRLRGSGTVEMPPRTLHYRVEPKIAATGEGQGGAADVGGLMVPVIVEGPWHKLSYKPDLTGLVEQAISDPGKLIEGAKGIEDAAKGLLKGILGGAAPDAGDQSSGEAPVNPLDAVKSLLGN